jgi:hypothetical protein
MTTNGKNCSTLRKMCPSSTLSTTNTIGTTLDSNPCNYGEMMVTVSAITKPAQKYSSELILTMNKKLCKSLYLYLSH